ncbi:hypothetical protein ACLOJK_019427 [Asimina triloba]
MYRERDTEGDSEKARREEGRENEDPRRRGRDMELERESERERGQVERGWVKTERETEGERLPNRREGGRSKLMRPSSLEREETVVGYGGERKREALRVEKER